jgi:hypothetical protein
MAHAGPRSLTLLALLALLVGACLPVPTPGEVEDVDVPFFEAAFLAPGEGVVIQGDPGDLDQEAELLECLADGIEDAEPPLRVIPTAGFRDALFPWFEPSTTPESEADFERTLAEPMVQAKLATMNARHLVSLKAETSETDMGGAEMIIVGVQGNTRTSRVAAEVVDLRSGENLGEAGVTVSGKQALVHYMLYGVMLFATTETTACEELGRDLASVLNGQAIVYPDARREPFGQDRLE